MSKLVTPDGQILITGIKDLIAPVTEDERKKFEAIHFKLQARGPGLQHACLTDVAGH